MRIDVIFSKILLVGLFSYGAYVILTPILQDPFSITNNDVIRIVFLTMLAFCAWFMGNTVGNVVFPKVIPRLIHYKEKLNELTILLKNIRLLQNEVKTIQDEVESFEKTRGVMFMTKFLQKWEQENKELSGKPMNEAMTEIYKDIEKLKTDVNNIKKHQNSSSSKKLENE